MCPAKVTGSGASSGNSHSTYCGRQGVQVKTDHPGCKLCRRGQGCKDTSRQCVRLTVAPVASPITSAFEFSSQNKGTYHLQPL